MTASLITLGVLVLVAVLALLLPTRGGWDGLTDAIVRAGIVGALSLATCLISVLGLANGSEHRLYHWVVMVVTAIPAVAALVGAVLLLRKML